MMNDTQDTQANGPEEFAAPAPKEFYTVPDVNLSNLRFKIAKLNKRAVKLGLTPIVLQTLETRNVEIWDDGMRTGQFRVYHDMKVIGETPKLNGWALQGTLEPIAEVGGNLVKCVPGIELPISYRTADPICQQCNLRRRRTETFVLRHDDGTYKQVGRNCIADFLGGVDPQMLIRCAEYLSEAVACLEEESEDRDGRGGSGYSNKLSLKHVLELTAVMIRAHGWTSRKSASEHIGLCATSSRVSDWMSTKSSDKKPAERALYAVTEADTLAAEAAIEYGKTLLGQPDLNDYLYNLSVIAQCALIESRSMGLACSLLPAHIREQGRAAELAHEKKLNADSNYVGTIGVREVFTLTVLQIIESESQFGALHIHKMTDAAGNRFTWFSSTQSLEIGKTYALKGTVKSHEEYRGTKQTVVSRCAIEPTKEQKKARKAAEVAWKKSQDAYYAYEQAFRDASFKGESTHNSDELKALRDAMHVCEGVYNKIQCEIEAGN